MILAILAVIWFFMIHPVYALSPPILSDPPNNSVIYSGPKLSWQAVIDSMGYKIMIDDESSITSPYAKTPYYTENTYYSPKLNSGSYYWKVGAKDSTGTWFWSDVWFFTLSTSSSSTPTPSPTSNPSPSPTPSPTSFIVSNFPSQINSEQSFNVTINLSLSSNPNTPFYLKGAFKKIDSSNYFGKTLVSGSWVKNNSSYSEQYKITTDSSGNWSGNLEVQPDSEDSGYSGTGDYLFKVGRYTQSGQGPTWSNETTIKIVSTEISDQGGLTTSTTSNDSSSVTNPPTSSSVNSKTSPSVKSKNSKELVYLIATVAGASASATPSATAEVKKEKRINIIIWIGGLLIISGVGLLIYIYLRSRKII